MRLDHKAIYKAYPNVAYSNDIGPVIQDAEVTRLNNAEPMRLLRIERDKKLAKTDWMTLSDTTTIADAWKTYRQQLRDLPASANPKLDARGELDLTSVTFPTEPS